MADSKMVRVSMLALVALVGLASTSRAEIIIKDGDSIAFLGDSITQQGAGSPGGYVRLVINGLEAAGIKATAIPAGIGGNKSNQMLDRLEKDVLSKKPAWMTLSCGVNDVWHGERGIPLEDYKKNITAIVERCQAAGVKVILLTATMIGEDASNANNQKLIPYNEFLRELAKEKNCPLADLNQRMQAAVQKRDPKTKGNVLTGDGVHMNAMGNQMMAEGVLATLGVTDEQIVTLREKWKDIPSTVSINAKAGLSLREMERLTKIAEDRKMTVQQLLDAEWAARAKQLAGESDGAAR